MFGIHQEGGTAGEEATRPAGRGRGTGLNPGNRFETVDLRVLGEHLEHERREAEDEGRWYDPAGDGRRTLVRPDRSRSVINRVNPTISPDIGFAWTLNPYRGCEHGCFYCYARPGHEFLGHSLGLDFESIIYAKYDAAQLLRRELGRPSWRGEPIVMSGVTDPYQPIERALRITRGCLEVMASCAQPVSFITKNRLILRDLDLLVELARHDAVRVAVSLTTLDRGLARVMEPRTTAPAGRLKTIEKLSEAGVPVRVMTAPIIPGLNDRELPALLEAASKAGARSAGYVLLRLPYQLKTLFLDWLRQHRPGRAGHVEALLRDTRNGLLYDARPGVRGRGEGAVAKQINQVFHVFARRHGLDGASGPASGAAFRRPTADGQMRLF